LSYWHLGIKTVFERYRIGEEWKDTCYSTLFYSYIEKKNIIDMKEEKEFDQGQIMYDMQEF
jgi:hypothetical protein